MSQRPGMQDFVRRKAKGGATSPNEPTRAIPTGPIDRKKLAEQARFNNVGGFGLTQQDISRAGEASRQSVPPWTASASNGAAHDRYDSELSESVTTRSDTRTNAKPFSQRKDVYEISSSSSNEDEGLSEHHDGEESDDEARNAPPMSQPAITLLDTTNDYLREFHDAGESQKRQEMLDALRAEKNRRDQASYPSTTSGADSTPFKKPALISRDGRSWQADRAFRPQSSDAHKHDYMKNSAMAYNRNHAALPNLAQKRSTVPAEPEPPMMNAGAAVTGPPPTSPAQSASRPGSQPNLFRLAAGPAVLAQTPEEHNTNDTSIDYEERTLHAKPFDDLRVESFEKDPGAVLNPNLLPQDASGPASDAQLEYACFALGIAEQADFCKTVPEKNWTVVDEWFTTQFSKLAKERTGKRNQRRDLANEFELQVAKRYDAVAEEIGGIDVALRALKTNGGAMLQQTTPKRKR